MPIYTLPSLRQPESIAPEFYFSSSVFLRKIKFDIDRLLNEWLKAINQSSLKPNNIKNSNNNRRINNDSKAENGREGYLDESSKSRVNEVENSDGPFTSFKRVYKDLGWIYIHLSVVDIGLRKPWFNTIVRLFLNEMKDQSNPLRQIGAFFGLWCFWGTQPEVLNPKQYVIVDTETFEYILSVPEKFEESINKKFGIRTDGFSNRERLQVPVQSQLNRKFIERHRVHLDPNLFGTKPTSSSSLSVISPSRNSSPLSTISSSSSSSLPSKPIVDACKPSDSLIQVLSNLVRSDAFLIEPEPTALRHPHLPSNNLAPENPTVAPVIPIQPPQPVVSKKPRKRNHLGELILSAKEELDRSALEMDRWDLSQLDQIRSNYLNSKSSFSILSSESSSNCESRKDKGRNHSSNQLRFDPLTDSIIGEAIGMTRRVIQKTGPGLDHLLFPKSPSACSSPSSMNLDNTTYRAGQDNRQTFGSKNALYLVEGSQNLDDVNNSISELQKL